jgi:hypothetical protein
MVISIVPSSGSAHKAPTNEAHRRAAAGGWAKAVEEAKKGTVKRSVAASEQDRASVATGVSHRADSSQQPLHTPYHAFIHPHSIAAWTGADPWTEWHRART